MRVLIVGCGYVGLPLGTELVKQGHEVFGLRRSPDGAADMQTAGIQPIIADVTKPETLPPLTPFDWVVNCAASGGGDVADYRQLYFHGTQNLIAWLAATPPKKYVYTSSTSVYGQDDGSLVKESSATEPATDTGKVLLETEKLLLLAAAAEKKLPAAILRVAGIYGPERGHWFKQFLRDEARIEGDGLRPLNMIHQDDVIGCIIAALKSGRAGEIYNACDDEPVAQIHFFRWLCESLNKPMPPSVPLDEVAARKRGTTSKKVSNRKLKMELGYQFKYPTFRQGYTAEIKRLGV